MARNLNLAKRPILIVLVCCFALLTLWYISGIVEDRSQAHQAPGTETPEVTGTGSAAGQNPAAVAYATTHRADSPVESSAGDLWHRFLERLGFTSGSRRSDISQPNLQGRPGEVPRRAGEEQDQSSSSISGRVLDEAGRPVPGMEIDAASVTLFGVPQKAWGGGVAMQAVSDDSGAYRLNQLQDGEYRIRTLRTDLYLPAEITVRTGVNTADLVVSGERDLSVQGSVKDGRGKPLQGVRVFSEQTPPLESSTDENGGFQIQIPVTPSDSSYVLRFQLAGYREATRSLSRNQMYSQSTVQLNILLIPIKVTAVVAGRVSNPEGAPLSGQLVSLQGPSRYEAATNQRGEFVMADVEAGQAYKLQVSPLNPYRPYVKQVQVGPEGLRQDIVLERGMPASSYLSGRMLDTSGNPLPRFSLWLQSLNPEAPTPIQVVADDAGKYAVDQVPLGGLSFTTRSQPRFLVSGISVPQGGAANVDLILDWGGYQVMGQVVDLDNNPVPGSRVVLFWAYVNNGVQSMSQREASTDAGGFFRFAEVGRGVHSIRVYAQGFLNRQFQVDVGADSAAPVLQLARTGQTLPGPD